MITFPKTGSEPVDVLPVVEPSPWGTGIGDAFGLVATIVSIPIAILLVGTPIVLAARLVIWLVARTFG